MSTESVLSWSEPSFWLEKLNWIESEWGLLSLFLSGFFGATLLPGGSEVNLLLLLNESSHNTILLVIIATLGNTLGAMTNYAIGLFFPNRPHDIENRKNNRIVQRAMSWMTSYGYFALLFSWLPLIGDGLCVAAGWLQLRIRRVCLFITVGKAARYTFIAWIFS